MVRRPPSLALRLTLLFGGAAAIVFSAFGWVIDRSIENHFETQDIAELRSIAEAVQRSLNRSRSADDLPGLKRAFDDLLAGHHGASLYVAGQEGEALFASPGPDFSALVVGDMAKSADGNVIRWQDGQHNYRLLNLRLGSDAVTRGGSYSVTVALAIDYHLRFLDGFRRTLWLMISSGIAIMALLGWIAVRQGHAPLRRIVARIRRISGNQLHSRLPPESVPVELADLALSFNEMLERVEEAFLRLSNFSADIAHELRTPVTSLMTQTQVALSQTRGVEEYREILYSNIEEYERMAQMIGDMLFLAQADDGLAMADVGPVDLADEVRALIEFYEAWAEEQGVSLALEGAATLLAGDRLMLRRALGNLLSNAIRYTPAKQTVRVRLGSSGSDAVDIVVENPGEMIPAEHINKLFDRFYRVDFSRQRRGEGTGLGLAIVKSIVEAHGGKIELSSSTVCTRFHITLPKTPPVMASHNTMLRS